MTIVKYLNSKLINTDLLKIISKLIHTEYLSLPNLQAWNEQVVPKVGMQCMTGWCMAGQRQMLRRWQTRICTVMWTKLCLLLREYSNNMAPCCYLKQTHHINLSIMYIISVNNKCKLCAIVSAINHHLESSQSMGSRCYENSHSHKHFVLC